MNKNKIMKRFIITEEEKNTILGMYKKDLLNEDIFSMFVGALSRFARKAVAQTEDDLIKAFKTTEAALAKNIDDIVNGAIKSGKMDDIQTLEAKLVDAFDPSGKNPTMAQEQTMKFLNSYAKSKGNTGGWKDIRAKAQPSTSAAQGAKAWANGSVTNNSRFSQADFSKGTNYQNKDMFNKIMAQESKYFQDMKKMGLDPSAFWKTVSASGFEKYGIKNMRDFLRKNVESVNLANPSTGEWSIKFKSVITDA